MYVKAISRTRVSIKPAKSFVIEYLISQSKPNQPLERIGYLERRVTAKGEYRETQHNFNGENRERIVSTEGFYSKPKGGSEWQLVSGHTNRHHETARNMDLLTHPQFHRTENVLGYKAFVLRLGEDSDYVELWLVPEFGSVPVKEVVYKMGYFDRIVEAIRINYEDVSDAEVSIANQPVKTNQAEKRIEKIKPSVRKKLQKDYRKK
jgi:hypothetical protein